MNNKTLVTVKAAHENFLCTLTQKYNEKHNTGHWQCVIFDFAGNIVYVTNSLGGPKDGKVTNKFAKELIAQFIKDTQDNGSDQWL